MNNSDDAGTFVPDPRLKREYLEPILQRHDEALEKLVSTRKPYKLGEITGVYFLFRGKQLMFVGYAVDVMVRIGQHWAKREIDFDSYNIVECDLEAIALVAAHFIAKYRPPLNQVLPAQPVYKTVKQLRFELDVGAIEIKRWIKEREIPNVNGYYRLWDFEDFKPGVCGPGHRIGARDVGRARAPAESGSGDATERDA